MSKAGRRRTFCSNACRQRNYRSRVAEPVPVALRSRNRWVRHIAKRPIATSGWFTSVHDEAAWISYREAKSLTVGDGFGFVLNGDGLTCVDLDDCVEAGEPTQAARDFIDNLAKWTGGPTYVEFSPSGGGLHVWGVSSLSKGRVLKSDGLKVEAYPSGRFITVTGRPYVRAEVNPRDMATALPLS